MVTVVLLGLGALAALVGVVLFLASRRFVRQCRAAAEKIHGEMVGMFSGVHEYRVLSAADRPELPRDGYERVAAALAARGFRSLGAFEDVTVSAVYPQNRTYMESHVSDDGGIGAVTYFVAAIQKQITDFSSTFADGRMVGTTNAELDTLRPPPWMHRENRPIDTGVEPLLDRHVEALAEFRERWPEAAPILAQTLDDVLARSRDYSVRNGEFRRSIGWLTEDELMSFAKDPGQLATAQQIWSEFREIVVRERHT